jgi:tetraacyldisaccharide 4'-kinase
LTLLSGLYGRAAAWRRAWYAGHPHRRRHLAQPVISVGNLSVGGSGKTPLVAMLAGMLQAHGEKPAILTRGYARRVPTDGVLVATDGRSVLEPVERTGDEPQMLARMLQGVPVLVSADRHLAGTLAERRFGCSVHILDDGFQHLQLARDVDLLLVSAADLDEGVLPSGRLREPWSAAAAADALVVSGSDADGAAASTQAGNRPVFRAVTHFGSLASSDPAAALPPAARRVVAVAGIARPERFFAALRSKGFEVVRELPFRDHHWFSSADVDRIERAAAESQADLIVTTEKDAVRLSERAWAVLPVRVSLEPADEFERWLLERLRLARAA